MDEILQPVINRLSTAGDNASVADIFDTDVLTRLADLEEYDYEKFKTLLEVHLIMSGRKIKNLNKLDVLVNAKREEIERARREMPPTLLSETCPDAPDAEILYVPPGWWLNDIGVGRVDGTGMRLPAVCNAPIYPSARVADYERARTLIRYVIKVDGKWRHLYIDAGSNKTATVRAVKSAGILVSSVESLADYLNESLVCNWHVMPVEEKGSLFEEFVGYFVEKSKKTSWWKAGSLKDGTKYIAVTPEAFRKFCKTAGTYPEQTLKMWQEEGILLSDSYGNYTKVLSLNGVKRRMIVFADFFFHVREESRAEAEKAS
ncbi:MAG: hypothetical protein K6U74_04995 [Firmicutes bacterium]|nr:hypothetical protein [Bacillota bacterium]